MCGIAGLVRRGGGDPEELRAQAVAMAETQAHRGPDDAQSWVSPKGDAAFGFRRLAILDLSPTGRQPMTSPTGRFVMQFNGEVYNFIELRDELRDEGVDFRGSSDTEVILAGFERWGVERTLPRLNGMYGLALWDHEREELFLVRDRLGIKPLYVAPTPEGLAFASELGALMSAPGIDKSLDHAAVLQYLGFIFVPAPGTPLQSARKLPPGHYLRVRPTEVTGSLPEWTPYWSLEEARAAGEAAAARSLDPQERVEALESLLSDAVKRRMIADVPLGAFLSGGIDSSLVVALMQRGSVDPVRTFTIGFDVPEHDESDDARLIAAHLGTDHTELHVTDRDALEVVPRLPEFFDEPLADPSGIPTYLVSRLAREHVTVALSGDGGDELFAGYTRYTAGASMIARFAPIPRMLRGPLGALLKVMPGWSWDLAQAAKGSDTRLLGQKAYKLGRILQAESAAEMYLQLLAPGERPERFLAHARGGIDPIRAGLPAGRAVGLGDMQLVDQRYYLPDDLLQKVDRASMAVSLEARVPILDHRVVEFAWSVPDALKVRESVGKWLLRQVLYRHVPRALVDRPKTGFTVPVATWLRGALREYAEDYLLGTQRTDDDLFQRAEIERAWKRLLRGRDEEALPLWSILMFEAWRERWGISAS